MTTDPREERRQRRIADLYANDQQFADARPSQAISAVIDRPELRLPQIVQTAMEGYAERPALGQRAMRFVSDAQTGRTVIELLPRFDMISCGDLWHRAGALAAVMAGDSTRRWPNGADQYWYWTTCGIFTSSTRWPPRSPRTR